MEADNDSVNVPGDESSSLTNQPLTQSASTEGAARSGITRFWGPGFLVAAAFIGPGTVNTSIRAGGNYGFQLMWTVILAAIATIVFQGMAVRLGLITKRGLAEVLANFFENKRWRLASLFLILFAILFGNTAYQAGNLAGAATGLHAFATFLPVKVWLVLCSGLAFVLLWKGDLKKLKIILSILVVLMSFNFLIAALLSRPSFPELWSGCFSFELFDVAVVVAMIGTTVVPYNLFLHSSTVAEQTEGIPVDLDDEPEKKMADNRLDYAEPTELDEALAGFRMDTWVAVWIGALVTGSIVITSAGTSATNFAEVADSLGSLVGALGKTLFFIGLFAAGLTSALTAPLAAGYVFAGCFGYPARADGTKVRQVAAVIVVIGCLIGLFGGSPEQIIFLAQIANGLVLPIIAIFLLVVMNSKRLLGRYRNGWQQNVIGGCIVLLIVSLGLYKLAKLFGVIS